MKNFAFILIASLLLSATCFADEFQDRRKFSPQEFMQKRDEFIANKAGLTPGEAAKLFPIYHQIDRQKFEIDRQLGKLMHDGKNPNLSEKEAQKILSEIDKLQIKKAKLDNEFHTKGRQVVTAHKILRVMHADWEFSRHVLHEMSKPNHNDRQPQKK